MILCMISRHWCSFWFIFTIRIRWWIRIRSYFSFLRNNRDHFSTFANRFNKHPNLHRRNYSRCIAMVKMRVSSVFDRDQMDVHVLYTNIDQIDQNQIFDWMKSMRLNSMQSMELHEEIEIPTKQNNREIIDRTFLHVIVWYEMSISLDTIAMFHSPKTFSILLIVHYDTNGNRVHSVDAWLLEEYSNHFDRIVHRFQSN